MYIRIAKYISWALLILGALLCIVGFIIGFGESNAVLVDTLLYYGYIICGISILAIIILAVINGIQGNPKSLLRAGIVVVVAVIVIGVIYAIAPGNLPVGWHGGDVTTFWLKTTDTLLILTYALAAVAICSIVAAVIVNAVRK